MGHEGAQRVEEAVADAVALLRTATDRDWEAVPAGALEWSCRRTAQHVASDLLAYAGQLAGRATDAYVPFRITLAADAGAADALDVIETAGTLFAATLRATPPGVRAFHPYPFGSADRDGFAAMGVAEVLVHTYDMAEGLGLVYEPPAELCAYVLTLIFPHVRPGEAPWPTLLWATGRGELPGRARLTEWRWRNDLVLPAGRLALRGVRPAAAAGLAVGGDGGFAWVEGGPGDGTREAAGALLKAYEAGTHRPEWGMFVIVRAEDGRALGGIGFHGPPDAEGRVEVGYDLSAAARGRGHATEALRALSAWALGRDEVTCVTATTEPGNLASQAVLARAGFTRTGRDTQEYAYELSGPRG